MSVLLELREQQELLGEPVALGGHPGGAKAGADKEILTTKAEMPVQLTLQREIRKIMGVDEEEADNDLPQQKKSELPFVPNYLANPPFPFIYSPEAEDSALLQNGGPSTPPPLQPHLPPPKTAPLCCCPRGEPPPGGLFQGTTLLWHWWRMVTWLPLLLSSNTRKHKTGACLSATIESEPLPVLFCPIQATCVSGASKWDIRRTGTSLPAIFLHWNISI
ncbi:Ankyrin repeat domain-containing protein 40 [Heterocephalus glaber]|uniref:Ankyrin repeat domain-containing protein 40 n=1 Tax=Heterocephalus glaber TaxID=10181 RepID=G5B2K1_HETGA|nr:Ankyrin repeat domain-containing protein 40 [Heterocephalus glaber]